LAGNKIEEFNFNIYHHNQDRDVYDVTSETDSQETFLSYLYQTSSITKTPPTGYELWSWSQWRYG